MPLFLTKEIIMKCILVVKLFWLQVCSDSLIYLLWKWIWFRFLKESSTIVVLKHSWSYRFTGVLAKIESLKSLEHLQDIIEASDGIIIARGDLGVQVSLEEIPAIQLRITQLCRQWNKPVIVAAQLLESMVEYPIPTRAEVLFLSLKHIFIHLLNTKIN